jgi:hypothetical protein
MLLFESEDIMTNLEEIISKERLNIDQPESKDHSWFGLQVWNMERHLGTLG